MWSLVGQLSVVWEPLATASAIPAVGPLPALVTRRRLHVVDLDRTGRDHGLLQRGKAHGSNSTDGGYRWQRRMEVFLAEHIYIV